MDPANLVALSVVGVIGLVCTAVDERGKNRFSVKSASFAALAAVYAAGTIGTFVRMAVLP